jgi:hypothetical protein
LERGVGAFGHAVHAADDVVAEHSSPSRHGDSMCCLTVRLRTGPGQGWCLAALWVVISIMRRRPALAEWCRGAGSVAGRCWRR